MKALTLVLAVLAAVATWLVFAPRSEKSAATPPPGYLAAKGDAFFAASFKPLGGSTQSLQAWRGKPVIAYFWASWCAECREEMKALQSVQDQYRERGLVVLGFGVDQADRIERFAREAGSGYPVFAGGQSAIALSVSMGNLREQMPYAVAFDGRGLPVASHLGPFKASTAKELAEAALR